MAQDYKTLRVPADAYAQANSDKREDETWGEFLQRCSDNPPQPIEYVDIEAVADDLVDELGATAGGPQVDDTDIAREVVASFDYRALADAVADELEGRLR